MWHATQRYNRTAAHRDSALPRYNTARTSPWEGKLPHGVAPSRAAHTSLRSAVFRESMDSSEDVFTEFGASQRPLVQ